MEIRVVCIFGNHLLILETVDILLPVERARVRMSINLIENSEEIESPAVRRVEVQRGLVREPTR